MALTRSPTVMPPAMVNVVERLVPVLMVIVSVAAKPRSVSGVCMVMAPWAPPTMGKTPPRRAVVAAEPWAWRARAWAFSTTRTMERIPLSAASSVLIAVPMPSSRLVMSVAREFNIAAEKKLPGLSSAVLTFLPVESRYWVRSRRSAVLISERRLPRMPFERTMSLMGGPRPGPTILTGL
jgi:hypothetical protein